MNIIKILIICMLANLFAQAQTKKQVSKSYLMVMPVFTDSSLFFKEILVDSIIKKEYNRLRKVPEYYTYNYSFSILTNGEIKALDYNQNTLDEFFKSKFIKYKWTAAYRKGCVKCKIRTYVALQLVLLPQNNVILININAGDGYNMKSYKTLLDKRIKIDGYL